MFAKKRRDIILFRYTNLSSKRHVKTLVFSHYLLAVTLDSRLSLTSGRDARFLLIPSGRDVNLATVFSFRSTTGERKLARYAKVWGVQGTNSSMGYTSSIVFVGIYSKSVARITGRPFN